MAEKEYPTLTRIFHFTHVGNLPEILESGCIFCQSRLPEGRRSVDISYYDIQERRKRKLVKCGPGGNLHDYVPLYFAPRSPMMYRISRGGLEGYEGGTAPLVYFVSSVQKIHEAGLGFVFTEGHPIKAFTRFFDDVARLGEVDWEVMRSKLWYDDDEHPDRKRRRQAEFLVYGEFPWSEVEFLVVKTRSMERRVENFLEASTSDVSRPVKVLPNWYF